MTDACEAIDMLLWVRLSYQLVNNLHEYPMLRPFFPSRIAP